MSTITFDTMEFADRLIKAGATPEYAKAEAAAIRDVLSSALDSTLATKADISDLKTEISNLKHDLDRSTDKMEAKHDKHSWMLGLVIAMLSAIFIKQFF